MKRDDIIRIARQHGKPVQEQNAETEYLLSLDGVAALLAAERAACADICDQHATCEGVAQLCAEAIRARGQA
jgi:phage I-like protein